MSEPFKVLSLGGGRQSSGVALMAEHGEMEKPDCAIFADTQDEGVKTYRWLDQLEKMLSFPVYRVTIGKLSELATRVRTSKKTGQNYLKPGLPTYTREVRGVAEIFGMMQRQCTLTAKIEPVRRKAKQLAGRGRPIVMQIGIARDEIRRMKPSKDARIVNAWPLVEQNISTAAVMKWMDEKGFPEVTRSACVYCPFHDDCEWHRMKTQEPEEFEKAVVFEKKMQAAVAQCSRLNGVPFLHESRKPLESVNFEVTKERDLFTNECEGMCGL